MNESEGIKMNEYNLDILYTGYEDLKFIEDCKKFENISLELNALVKTLDVKNQKEKIIEILGWNEKKMNLEKDLTNFVGLKSRANTSDKLAINFISKFNQINSDMTKNMILMNKYISECKDLKQFIKEDNYLRQYEYYLLNILEDAKHILSDEVEEALSKMNINGGLTWEQQWEYLTSSVEIELNGKMYGLAALRNFAYEDDAALRKQAYVAELKGYDKIKDAIAFSLNAIKGQVNIVSEMRGFESPLAQALNHSDMKQETLDAMFEAIKEYMPKFRAYLKRKGELLNHNNGLPFYDLFASVAKSSKKYSLEDAHSYLVSNFSTFSEELSNMVDRAFKEEWIDFYPRKGKVGGAFCLNMPRYNQSRILTNYDGSFSDVVTLAHELGHAFHGQQIKNHLPLNLSYSMPLAETASTFNENLIMNKAIKEATGEEQIALIESQLQDATQIILDIYSRFTFEKEVFDRRKNEFLFADQLEEIMINAQKEAYGDGLDNNCLHPYMWICKPHYYDSSLSFYNFPYAFGGLFARGLYALYQEEGASFVEKYKVMLKATTISSVEECAKTIGIDLTKKSFWEKSLASFTEIIDTFLEATNT